MIELPHESSCIPPQPSTLTSNTDKDCISQRLLKFICKSDRLYSTQSQPK
ncbi:hypothetical protein COO91_07236 [Nostoc flagelliforme CCNUN1]|uniref:Uncharacterized protein n=1 Tax=Nostoc flagelliforme CCNUN1 TaxID=2038116 RepID=A0A2K8T0I5_9NOSO|nr:hypothetical protein COO91_07236 [Nostoc flagelliforme CCNUN1]